MTAKHVAPDIPGTAHFHFLYGRYRLNSSWTLPYFSTTMSLKEVAQNLKLAAEFPWTDQINWKLEELYQRDVNWPRVERKILPYLSHPKALQFFNALTIALLPLQDDAKTLPESFNDYDAWTPPPLNDEKENFGPNAAGKSLRVGPISFGFWEEWSEITDRGGKTGVLRWNPDQVFAVALDGQHRLAAIQQFAERQTVPASYLKETCVPIILVVLDPRVGYLHPEGTELVDTLRAIFIDLNKHAEVPSRARQILLDDRDPTAVCVRALVGDVLCDGLDELTARVPKLPLSLIDWHTEQAKFDEGPHIATILGLDWAVGKMLNVKPLRDFTDYQAVRAQLKALSKALSIPFDKAGERLANLEAIEQKPFSYDEEPENNELAQVSEAFKRVWNPVFTLLLTAFQPYKDLIETRRKRKTVGLEFVNWYRLYYQAAKDTYGGRASDDYKKFLGRLNSKDNPIGEKQLRETLAVLDGQKKSNLAFNVVFQRAYFLAFNEWLAVRDEHLEGITHEEENDFIEEEEGEEEGVDVEADDDSEEHDVATVNLKRAEEFVKGMNALVTECGDILNPEFVYQTADGTEARFWLGTFLTVEKGIDFTQAASGRAKEVLFWAIAMQTYDSEVEPEEESDFSDFWTTVMDPETEISFLRRVSRSVKRFSDKVDGSAGARILLSKKEKFTVAGSREEARQRMEWLWANLGL